MYISTLRKNSLIWISCIAFFSFLSCQKEISGPDDFVSNQRLTIEGIVTGPNGIPLKNVLVKAGNLQVETDINGSFRITNAQFSTPESFVVASKSGFFTGSRTFLPRSTGNNFLKIQLLPFTEAGRINSTTGGQVNIGGTTISFPANAFSNTDGSAYSGTVSVKAAYLDPTSPVINEQMPGDLRGININGNLRGLKSFGMVNVELESSTGQRIILKTGSTAQISYSIPAGLLANAPSSVPMWWFDMNTGLWKEEGSAQKTGSRYVGNVSHFTFWNVDEPFEYVKLKMRVVTPSTQPVQAARVELTSLIDSSAAYDYTDHNGYVDGYVPINVRLRRDIYNECNALISSQEIGPFNVDTDLGNLQVNALTNQQTISGTVTNCANIPLATGYVIISMPGHTVYANVTNGNFTSTFSRCTANSTATIIAVDPATSQQGAPVTISFSSAVVNAGALQACGVVTSEFLTIVVDGVSRTWTTPVYDLYGEQDTLNNAGFYELYIGAYDTSLGGSVGIILSRAQDSTTTPFHTSIVSMSIYDQLAAPNMIGDYFLDNSVFVLPMARMTEYGPVGQFITGNFTGRFIKSRAPNVDTVTVNCNFRVRRQ